MSDCPKVYAIRPGELRQQVMRWLERLDEHLVSDEPNDD